MNRKQKIIEAMRAFINQRSGIDWRNYGGSRDAFMGDYRPMLRDGKTARELLRIVEASDAMTAEMIVENSKHSFSGRLSIVEKDDGSVYVDYCAGQYFVTEYRKAACAVLGDVVRTVYGKDYTNYQEWHKYARRAFGRNLSKWM